jgi:glycosyltransferase involved in cell wall biosynthesis
MPERRRRSARTAPAVKIAIVSYFAPPQPAVASHRVIRMTRALRAAGHDVHWVTLDPRALDRVDETLAAVTPPGVRVHGLGGVNLVDRTANGFVEKVVRTLIFALPDWWPVLDRHVEWSRRLVRELPGIVRQEGIDAVLLCCGPHGQLECIPALRRRCPGVRVLVDYRDLLSGNTWRDRKTERMRARVQARERRLLAGAEALSVNTADALDSFLKTFDGFEGLPVEVVRNAADHELGAQILGLGPAVDLGPGLHLGFFGTIFPKRRLRPLLDAMARLDARHLAGLHVHVWCDAAGSASLLAEDLAAATPQVAARVTRHDFLGYGDALRTMAACDALVLVNSPDPADQIFVPGKLYDYLMAARPVLFFGDRGDAWNIVADTSGADACFTHEEPDRAAAWLEALVSHGRPADRPPVAAYEPAASFAPLLRRLAGDRA